MKAEDKADSYWKLRCVELTGLKEMPGKKLCLRVGTDNLAESDLD